MAFVADVDAARNFPEHSAVMVWLWVLEPDVSLAMLASVLDGFGYGWLRTGGDTVSRVLAIASELSRIGLLTERAGLWSLTEAGRSWCRGWKQPGSAFALRLAAVREFAGNTQVTHSR